jgi:nucleotidyltransferase/DNA polymerase involved in DNA repair
VPRVAALRVPWFAAAAQCRREPALAGQPLALGVPKQGTWRVAAVSAAAAEAGVRVGMPLAQAESLCPTLVRRPLDPAYLAHESERLLAALEAYVAVEPAEPGGALFDGRGSDACSIPHRRAGGRESIQPSTPGPWPLAPGPQCQLSWLIEALAASTGYVAAVGVAEGRGAAWIAAQRAVAGTVVWVPPGETAAYLAPLPAALLPVSAEMRRRLELLGLRTIRALAALPLGALQAQFGPEGRLAWEIAHGCDRRPLALRTPPCVPSAAVAFDTPCVDRAQLLAAAENLLDRAQREVPSGQVVGSLHLLVELEGPWVPVTIALHDPTAELGALRRALQTALLRTTLPAAVLGVRLELRDLGPPTPLQPALFDARGAARLALTAATRSLRTRFGANPLQRVVALDPRHRLPERRYALVEAS